MHSESDPFGMRADEAERKAFGGSTTIPDNERRSGDRTPSHVDIVLRIEALQERVNIAQQDTEQFRRGIREDILNATARVDAALELMKESARYARANNENMVKLIDSLHIFAMRSK